MNILKVIISFIICLSVIFYVQLISYAQDYNNVLPLHTGKSYILDFPVKVTRVVGGDPSAMELNLFKKDASNGEVPGYQLLIAPIAEKNTNIIVWTEIGMYVFDVDIDNSSPYTAETIVMVPKIKRFTIPLTESSNSKGLPDNINKDNQVAISQSTGDIIESNKDKESKQNIENKENNNLAQTTDLLDVLQKPNNSDPSKISDIKLDSPPQPEKKELKKKKKFSFFSLSKKEDTVPETKKDNISKNNEEIILKKDEKTKPSNTENKKIEKPLKPIKVELKPQIPINTSSPVSLTNSTAQKSEEVITLNTPPAKKTKSSQPKSQIESSVTSNTTSSKTINKEIKDPLKLSINKISKFDDKIVINITVINNSNECKYILWDLTKVIDQTGSSFYVKNLNLPPGIINPSQTLSGDIAAYSRPGKRNQIATTNQLKVSIYGSQGQLLINSDISIK